ncbi:TetR/AcrR family transcriptional regulator [Enhygromyxa salina]|uniref:TetR/AcrR family transcriptional regulator n=1 Tax=Enhygromyxa salina TaxID=215803 RepID=UPI001C63455B|nr:TetR/AcrR family transcriptional regulator [Enhygromyxa salina]
MARSARSRKSYHHGDLRASLLDAAVELIAERGLHGLSLRECARRAGVSHAAPYRHFADKDALLLAIARRGFELLTRTGVAAMRGVEDPRDRLDAYGVAYVRFAVDNPVLFRVMFTAEIEEPEPESEPEPEPESQDHTGRAFELLMEAAAAVVGEDSEQAQELAAVASWSLPHGLAMLILDGRIPAEQASTPDEAEDLARKILAQWRGPLS